MKMIEKIKGEFRKRFSGDPLIVLSPGRVNLIGEHTDYNDGFVLPAAIDKKVVIALAENGTKQCHVYATAFNTQSSFSLEDIKPQDGWINYVLGVVYHMQEKGHVISGFDAVIDSDLPVGAGLSSSAALEGAISFGLNQLFDLDIDSAELAKTGQLAEHTFAGVKCGIMDQFANLHGKKDQLIRLDCRDLRYTYFPFHFPDYKIVLCNSMVHHSLASTEYNVRRQQCEAGVAAIKKHFPDIKNLRDVSANMLLQCKNEMSELVYRRCHYVIDEIERVLKACALLEQNDLMGFGQLMYATHDGLSKEYEVSCEELDFLVDLARLDPEVAGARMMGGGFGGCTINIIRTDQIDAFSKMIQRRYSERYKKSPEIYVTSIEDGTRTL